MRTAVLAASLLTLLLLLPSHESAQSGRVLRLSDYDAAKAKRLYTAKELANREWGEFNANLKRDYTETPYPPADGEWRVYDQDTQRWYEEGFSSGFHFSEDFHYILEGADPE